jgi:hypothetical protein
LGSIIDAVLFWLGAFVAGCLLALFLLTALGAGLVKAAGLRPQPGGSETPPASNGLSHAMTFTTARTRGTGGFSSSSTAPGGQSEAAAILQARLAQSRRGAPTPCGCGEAGSPGQPRPAAVSTDGKHWVVTDADGTERYVSNADVDSALSSNDAWEAWKQLRDAALDRGWGEDRDGNVIVWED